MKDDREIARDYLRTPPGAPWRWEDGGRTLVWEDGATVAFREELAAIFERLAPGELPPFPVLVCVLAACRGRYLSLPRREPVSGDAKQAVLPGFAGVLSLRAEQVAEEQLRKLSALPNDVIGHPRGKALLAQIVFEARERGGDVGAAQVLKGLEAGLREAELNAAPAGPDETGFDAAAILHRAAQPLRGHTAESLRLRLRTGLDAPPTADAVELALPRGERARRLLARLAEDEQNGGLALVARDLMAAIRLPSVLTRADEQAAGGASGLGNRGTLDRLLLSELAHDDLTLATRVALNEALYLHREPPARRPRRGLALLIDSGLRMWGVPRLLGTAAGLALLAGWPDDAEARVWRADDTGVTPVDLLDEAGMTSHLETLGVALHPGRALAGFVAAAGDETESDLVIVTHWQALQTAEFHRQLLGVSAKRAFLVLVDHAGLVQLHALPWSGEGARPLVAAQADLDKLCAEKPRTATKAPATPLVNPSATLDLPAIFRAPIFPLLLPIIGKLDRTVQRGEGGLCVTGDRRLFAWETSKRGARQLRADLPGGQTCLLAGRPDGSIIAVRGRDKSGMMAVIGFASETAEPKVARLTGPHHPLGVYLDHAAVLIVMHTRAAAVAVDASAVLGETPLPDGLKPIGGRYAVDGTDLWFASWDGACVRWDRTEMGRHLKVDLIVGAFERDGVGPWVVTRDQRVLGPAGNEWMRLDFVPDQVTPLHAGDQLLIQSAGKTPARFFVFLASRQFRRVEANRISSDAATLLPPPSRQLQSRIEAIHAVPGQPLKLLNAKGRWLEVFAQRDGLRLVEAAKTANRLEDEAKRFVSVSSPASLGCALKRATWPCGSSVWLDDRGMLHFRSRNKDLPEFTLTLCVGLPLAGWASDGTMWGPEFFIGSKEAARNEVVLSLLIRFSNALC